MNFLQQKIDWLVGTASDALGGLVGASKLATKPLHKTVYSRITAPARLKHDNLGLTIKSRDEAKADRRRVRTKAGLAKVRMKSTQWLLLKILLGLSTLVIVKANNNLEATFETSVSTGTLTMELSSNNFWGAAAVGTKVVFAPFYDDEVGVYDTILNSFDASVSTGLGSNSNMFSGAAAVGTKVVFAPYDANVVGVFDTISNSFDASVSTGALTMWYKFIGAAAVGTKVVFAPQNADVVGVYDTISNSFNASVSTGALTMGNKFSGAAAVGTKVVFAPYNADVVGVYDTISNSFDGSVSTGALTMDEKFMGAAVVGTKVVFAPYYADVVGVYDTISKSFDASVSTGALTMNYKFIGAAAVGTKVVFAPNWADVVGVYDTISNSFDASVSTGALTMGNKFSNAAAVGTKVVFAPRDADVVGVFKIISHEKILADHPCFLGWSDSIICHEEKLEGTLPSEIGLNTALTNLILTLNDFEGTLPSELGLLSRLTFLGLGSNNFEGALPTQLGLLTTLSQMEFDHNSLNGPLSSEVGLLTKLTKFGLSGNSMKGTLPSELGRLEKLTHLGIEFNSFNEAKLPSELGLLHMLPIGTFQQATNVSTALYKFSGAAAVGSKVVFAPFRADVVDVFDTISNSFEASVSTGELTMHDQFRGAAAVGTKIVFAPWEADVVGVYDTIFNSFNASVSTGNLIMDWKFSGAAAVGTKVVFAPSSANVVGIFDTISNFFDASVSTGYCGTVGGRYKFSGAAAVGTKVVFAPRDADVVGVFDIISNSFDASVSTGALTIYNKFSGAAAVGTKVIFAPWNADVVGVYETVSSSFDTSVSTGALTTNYKFSGAAAVGTKVVFAPYDANVVGVFDTISNSFDASASTGALTVHAKFIGAVAIRNKVVFAPFNADAVGVFDISALALIRVKELSRHPCYWEASKGSSVKLMNCQGKELEGSLPSELGLLTNLTQMEFDHNSLNGTLPSEVGLLTKLTKLGLRGNSMKGRLPSQLGQLTHLTSVSFDNNKFQPSIPTELIKQTFFDSFDASVSTGTCGALNGWYKFSGAAAVGTKVVFAPWYADVVGVYDTISNSFDTSTSTGALTEDAKFMGAAAVGTKVVFAPSDADVVGVYDTSSNSFDASVSTGALSITSKFRGAAAVGTKVVFAPLNANVVGIFDTATNAFEARVSTGALTTPLKFSGAAAVGTKVVFAPHYADVVGVYDTISNSFDASVSTGTCGALNGWYKFSGAAAVGTKVVFAPLNANVVGVYDTATNTFEASVSTGALTMNFKFSGAAAVGTKVVFAPFDADVVGVYDTSSNSFEARVSTGALDLYYKFSGIVAVGTKVVFAPYHADVVGVSELQSFAKIIGVRKFADHPCYWRSLDYKVNCLGEDLKGTLPTDLGLFRELTDLNLGANSLEGTVPTELGLIIALETLDLSDNSLEGTLPTELGLLKRLTFLGLAFNYLTGTLPSGLGMLTAMQTVDLRGSYNKRNKDGYIVQHGANLFSGCVPRCFNEIVEGRCNNERSKIDEISSCIEWRPAPQVDTNPNEDVWKTCDYKCICPAGYRRGLEIGSCSSGDPFNSRDFCFVVPTPPAKVTGPPLVDICYLNPKYISTQTESGEEESRLRPLSLSVCDKIWAQSPYLAWPRASSPFVGSVTAWPDALDRVLVDAEGALKAAAVNGECFDAMWAFVCTSLKPQCRTVRDDRGLGKQIPCRTCRNTCSDYKNACEKVLEPIAAAVQSTLNAVDEKAKFSRGLVCDASSKAIRDRIKALFVPDCTDTAQYPTSKCSSNRPETCIGGNDNTSVPLILPEASFRGNEDLLGSGRARWNSLGEIIQEQANDNAVLRIPPKSQLSFEGDAVVSSSLWPTRLNQFTVVLDIRTVGSREDVTSECQLESKLRVSRLPRYQDSEEQVVSTCILADGNLSEAACTDTPGWNFTMGGGTTGGSYFYDCKKIEEMGQCYTPFGLEDYGQGPAVENCCACGKTKTYCSLLGSLDGCPHGGNRCPRLDFVVGNEPLNSAEFLANARSAFNKPEASGLNNWTRIVLSVDLMSHYARLWTRRAPDPPAKMYDERWMLSDQKGAGFDRSAVLRDFLNVDGSFSLPPSLVVASHGCMTTEVAGITVYRSALHEEEAEILAQQQPKDGATSFFVWFEPQGEIKQTEGKFAEITVQLLHPPPAEKVNITLTVADTRRVRTNTSDVTLHRSNWNATAVINISFLEDNKAYQEPEESIIVSFASSPSSAWTQNFVTLKIVDNDQAGVMLNIGATTSEEDEVSFLHYFETYEVSKWINPEINARESTAPAAEHIFYSKKKGGFLCLPNQETAEEDKVFVALGEGSLRTLKLHQEVNPTIKYSLHLNSEPNGTVSLRVQLLLGGQSIASAPIVKIEPSLLHFSPTTWQSAQQVQLTWNDAFASADEQTYIIHHFSNSSDDEDYASDLQILPLEVIAVPATSSGVDAGVFVGVVLLLVAVAGVGVFYFRRGKEKAEAQVYAVEEEIEKVEKDAEKAKAKLEKEKAETEEENIKLKENLIAAQQVVDKVMQEGGTLLSLVKNINYSDIDFEKTIGEGGFGTVYKATWKGRAVAVKTVRTTKVTEEVLGHFKGEIAVMAPLHHPNLVNMVGACWKDGPDKLCLVLEFCAQGSVKTILKQPKYTWSKRSNVPTSGTNYKLALGIARCFNYLHHEQPNGKVLIHRDLKPDNVLVSDELVAKVADFGESKQFDKDKAKNTDRQVNESDDEDGLVATAVQTMTLVGTPMYCAPEIIACLPYNEKVEQVFAISSYVLKDLCLLNCDKKCLLVLRNASGTCNWRAALRKRSVYSCGNAGGWRPRAPQRLVKTLPTLWQLVRDCWEDYPTDRPSFEIIEERLEEVDPSSDEKDFQPTNEDYKKLEADKDELEQRALKGLAQLLDQIDEKDAEIAKMKASTFRGRMTEELKQVDAELKSSRSREENLLRQNKELLERIEELSASNK